MTGLLRTSFAVVIAIRTILGNGQKERMNGAYLNHAKCGELGIKSILWGMRLLGLL